MSQLKKYFPYPIQGLICAKTRSGKSVLLRKIIDASKKDYTKIIIMSPTCNINEDWEPYRQGVRNSEKFYFIDEPSIDFVKELFEGLLEERKLCKRNKVEMKNKVLLVMDDCSDFINNRSVGSIFNKIAWMGRNLNMGFVYTAHMWKGIPTILRQQAHQKVFFNTGDDFELRKICEDCSSRKYTRDELMDFIGEHAVNYSSVLVQSLEEDPLIILDKNIK